MTLTVAVEVLLAMLASGCGELTVAVFEIVPAEFKETVIANVAVTPFFKPPKLQIIVLVPLQLP